MKIFHIITLSTPGGAQSVVINLANQQVKENEVFVVSSAEGTAWISLDKRVHVIKINALKRNISWRDIIVCFYLLYYYLKYKPDVIHLHSSKIGALGRMMLPRKKVVYTVHGFDSMRIANRKFLYIEKFLKNCCSFIVGVSRYDERNLISEGISKNVSYIYNGINDCAKSEKNDIQDIIDRINDLRKKYSNIIITIARDDPPKCLELFLKVAESLPQYGFVWIGNKNTYEASDNVCFLGIIPDAQRIIEFSDLFVLFSNYEGMPMCIIEALAYGKPVVASDVGGISEMLDGGNGYVVENEGSAICSKISKILENPELYKKMSINARKSYEDKFTIERMVNGYRKLYEQIYSRNSK